MSRGDGKKGWAVIYERRQEASRRRAAVCSAGMLFDPAFNCDEQAALTGIAQQAAREADLIQFDNWCQRDLRSLTTDADIALRLAKIEAEERASPSAARRWISKSKASLSNLAGKLGLGHAAAAEPPASAEGGSSSSLAKRQLKSMSKISQAMTRMASSLSDSVACTSPSTAVGTAAAAAAQGGQKRVPQAVQQQVLLPPLLMLTARRRNSFWKVVTDMEGDEDDDEGNFLENPPPPGHDPPQQTPQQKQQQSPLQQQRETAQLGTAMLRLPSAYAEQPRLAPLPLSPQGLPPLMASPDPCSLPPISASSPMTSAVGDELLLSSSHQLWPGSADSSTLSTCALLPPAFLTTAGTITSPAGKEVQLRHSPWSAPGSTPARYAALPDPSDPNCSALPPAAVCSSPLAASGQRRDGLLTSELGGVSSRAPRRMDSTPLPARRGRMTPLWREILVAGRTGRDQYAAAWPCVGPAAGDMDPAGGQRLNRSESTITCNEGAAVVNAVGL